MTSKRFDWDVCEGDALFYEDGAVIDYDDVVELLNELADENEELKNSNHRLSQNLINSLDRLIQLEKENEQLKKENNKLHQKIFEMRTNIALERTEISRQAYTGKKNKKEYLTATEFLNEMEKW